MEVSAYFIDENIIVLTSDMTGDILGVKLMVGGIKVWRVKRTGKFIVKSL